jgi:hypothetical protein
LKALEITNEIQRDNALVRLLKLPLRAIGKIKQLYINIKADFKEPLPELEGLPKSARFKARFRIIYKKYGWKILAAIVIYYLIRDMTLYIILPYLIARGLVNQ